MSVFDNMVKFLDSTWIAKDVIVPCLIGPVGIGKTAAVYQHAENVGANKVVTIIASQILPNEVSGITMPVTENKSMEIFDHYRLSSLEDGDILFFDELLEADQMVLSACLTLIESRQMMSGRKLPDVQIIAATNPTIKPNMLKENIRQRFVFRSFDIDQTGCVNYIKDQYNLDVSELINLIVGTGEEYNIMTQRSLTKMACWISRAKNIDEARTIGESINSIWHSSVGDVLIEAWIKSNADPMKQVKNIVRDVMSESDSAVNINFDDFKEDTIEDVMNLLQQLPEWEEIERRLTTTMVEDGKQDKVSF